MDGWAGCASLSAGAWPSSLLPICHPLIMPTPLAAQDAVPRLAGALLGDTPMVEDLRSLTDKIGGRPAGSPANLRAIEWALERFRAAGVPATKEAFRMPGLWLRALGHAPSCAAPASSLRRGSRPCRTRPARAPGLTAPLVDGGLGREEDYRALGSALGARSC